MNTPPKRLPVCGSLAFAAALAAALLCYWTYRPPAFLKDDTGRTFFFTTLLMYLCVGCGFACAVAALARRERYWILPVLALLLDLAWLGFFVWAMLLLCLHGGAGAGG